MIILILTILVLSLIIMMIKNKIWIRIDTFFRKGFPKHDDKYGIYCFTGKQGSGKTYSVIDFLAETKNKKQKVLTNVKSYYNSHKGETIYCEDFGKIVELCEKDGYGKKYIIFFDEIFTLIEKGKLDKHMLSFLSQMRKRGLILLTTAQEWLEINVTFRRYVRFQIDVAMINIPVLNFAILINKVNDAYQMKWDNLQNEYVCPIIRTNIKKCSKKIADSYDTYETIATNK